MTLDAGKPGTRVFSTQTDKIRFWVTFKFFFLVSITQLPNATW